MDRGVCLPQAGLDAALPDGNRALGGRIHHFILRHLSLATAFIRR